MVAKDKDDNHRLAKVLDVLALLVKYGYYDDPKDVDAVLKPLVDVMNGFTDVAFPHDMDDNLSILVMKQLKDFKDSGRFKETDDNLAMFTVKERAIEVIDLLFNFRFYVRLQVRISVLPQHTLATAPLSFCRGSSLSFVS